MQVLQKIYFKITVNNLFTKLPFLFILFYQIAVPSDGKSRV